MIIFLVISLLIALVAVVFAVQNTALITVSFLAWNTQGSLALILLLTLAAGGLVSYLATLPAILRDKWTQRGLRKRITELEARLAVSASKVQELEARLKPAEEPKPATTLPPASAGNGSIPPNLPPS